MRSVRHVGKTDMSVYHERGSEGGSHSHLHRPRGLGSEHPMRKLQKGRKAAPRSMDSYLAVHLIPDQDTERRWTCSLWDVDTRIIPLYQHKSILSVLHRDKFLREAF